MIDAVTITFECLPLRTIGRLDIPLDASAEYRAYCARLKNAIEQHSTENTYYLLSARAVFHLANSEISGMLRFEFEGTVTTDVSDTRAETADLDVRLTGETCGDVPEAVVDWFSRHTVPQAVLIEFDRFIAAGSLTVALKKSEQLRRESVSDADFLGMYL